MNHRTMLVAAALLAVALRPVVQAQATQPATAFSAEEILKVTTAAVLDVSDDGRYVAYTTRRAIDNATTDHRRYGDPTYLAPSAVRLFVVDTTTAAATPVLPDLADIRQAAWSRAGTHLAFLQIQPGSASGDPSVRLRVWDAGRKALRDVPLKGDARIAVNSSLAWSPDGSRVVVALRSAARDDEAQKRFKAITDGPVIVHSSKDPFSSRRTRFRATAPSSRSRKT